MTRPKHALKPTLGVTALSFYGIGMILGAGIYAVIGAAAAKAGMALWMSFLLSAVIVVITAISYAELATLFPEAGAEYVYLQKAFPKLPIIGFLTGLFIAVSGTATTGAVSLAFGGYLQNLIHFPAIYTAAALLVVISVVAILGIQQSSWVNIAFTLIEVSGLIGIIYLGFQHENFGLNIFSGTPSGVTGAAAVVFFSYLGFENIANLAEESVSPEKNIPKAIFISVFATTVIYVLVGIAVVALVDPAELASSISPLATAAEKASPIFSRILGVIALFATANTGLVCLIVTSRVLFSMARRGDLPKFLASVRSKNKTPHVASIFVFLCALLLLPLGKVEWIANVSSLAALLGFSLVNAALIVLRYREPKVHRSFRVPFQIGRFPPLPAIGIVCNLMLASQVPWQPYVIVTTALILFSILYGIRKLRKKSS